MAALVQLGPAPVSLAPILAEMSRDLIEDGLGHRWRAASIARHVRDPDSEVAVACDGDVVVGFVVARFFSQRVHVNLLAVRPQYRRRGVGQLLMHWVESMAIVAGCFSVSLEVRAKNQGARRFYQRLGYRHVQTLSEYYDGREAAHRMQRDLRID